MAIDSYAHHKRNPFLVLTHANYWSYVSRRNEHDEEYLQGFQLEYDQIEWLHQELGRHIAHRKLMEEEINYKKGDKVRLKSGAIIPYVEKDAVFKATHMGLDHNKDSIGISKVDSKNLWCFAPAWV